MAKPLTTGEFIQRAKKIHGDNYDYSRVSYKNSHTKIRIICHEHGEFEQKSIYHLNGNGCPKCGQLRKRKRLQSTMNSFIELSQKIHGLKYNYNEVNYINQKTKVKIICPEHGIFEQQPNSHLSGAGCPKCSSGRFNSSLSNKDFLKRANKKHNSRYQYPEKYTRAHDYIEIICPSHGSFKQKAYLHLQGQGCPECGHQKSNNKRKLSNKDFLKRANKKHNSRYQYPEKYTRAHDYIEIICPIHGSFKQKAYLHLQGQGCPECGGTKKFTFEKFIKKAQEIHNKYQYDEKSYKNTSSNIKIICPEHGEFKQLVVEHLKGSGCPKCADHGFNPDKPAILYYLKDTETGLYKIGISNKSSIEERFGKAFCSKRAIALKEQSFNSGQEALEYEQEILEQFAYIRCVNSSWPIKLGGRTEFFKEDILNTLY